MRNIENLALNVAWHNKNTLDIQIMKNLNECLKMHIVRLLQSNYTNVNALIKIKLDFCD